jgi:RNA polymerase sigma-70 factor (ECF subfamily)
VFLCYHQLFLADADTGKMSNINPIDEAELLRSAGDGNGEAMGRLLENHRLRLERILQLRLDQRIQSRINPSDVLQETFIEAAQRLKEYLHNPEVPFFIWLRYLANQRLSKLHRYHLGAQSRSAGREVSIDQAGFASFSSVILARQLVGQLPSASSTLQKAELRKHLEDVLEGLEPIDREILALRHFEQLTNLECSQVLALTPTTANNRYVRALERLRTKIGGDEDFRTA